MTQMRGRILSGPGRAGTFGPMPESILVNVAGGVATLTLNRPEKKNALSIALRDEVSDAIDSLAADASVKAIVLTGAGEVFSAGFDLKEFRELSDPDHARRLWDSSDRFHHTILDCPLPTIAAVNGPAPAGGFDRIRKSRSTGHNVAVVESDGGQVLHATPDAIGGASDGEPVEEFPGDARPRPARDCSCRSRREGIRGQRRR